MFKSRLVPYLEAGFAAVVWGASFIATKIALAEISPITIVWLRFLMGVVILGIAVISRKQFALPKKNEWGYFALLGFLGITFHQWLQSNGLQTSEASTTAWIVATTPVFMALLGWLILKERLNSLKIFGILLAFCGVLLVVSDGDISSISIGKFGAPGDVLILISAINWAVFSALTRRGLKTYSASLMIFYVMLSGWIFTSVLFISSGNYVEISALSINGWMGVTFLGVLCSGFAYIAW
ncbi:MAG TPA: DMT family transporter, partial [Anaerolineales bacterium]|nr:DMT family transporter [Anaerolineales bacterium]